MLQLMDPVEVRTHPNTVMAWQDYPCGREVFVCKAASDKSRRRFSFSAFSLLLPRPCRVRTPPTYTGWFSLRLTCPSCAAVAFCIRPCECDVRMLPGPFLLLLLPLFDTPSPLRHHTHVTAKQVPVPVCTVSTVWGMANFRGAAVVVYRDA